MLVWFYPAVVEEEEEEEEEEKTEKEESEDKEEKPEEDKDKVVNPKEVLKKAKVEDDEYKEVIGGEKNYYSIAHTIKEEVREQPTILVNGRLKEYQIKVSI